MKYLKILFSKLPRIMYAHKCTIDNINMIERKNTYHEITFVFDGEFQVTAESGQYIIRKNQFFYAPAGFKYEGKISKKLTHSCVAFFTDSPFELVNENEISFTYSNNRFKTEIEPLYIPLVGELNPLSLELMGSIVNLNNRKREYQNLLFGAEIVELCSSIAYTQENNALRTTSSTYALLVDNFLLQNYNNPDLNLNIISSNIGLNLNYLCEIYKKETGKTIIQKLIEIRIESAKNLLLLNKYKIKDVSELVGLVDPNYFSLFFKKIVGVTPKEYINLNASKDI